MGALMSSRRVWADGVLEILKEQLTHPTRGLPGHVGALSRLRALPRSVPGGISAGRTVEYYPGVGLMYRLRLCANDRLRGFRCGKQIGSYLNRDRRILWFISCSR